MGNIAKEAIKVRVIDAGNTRRNPLSYKKFKYWIPVIGHPRDRGPDYLVNWRAENQSRSRILV